MSHTSQTIYTNGRKDALAAIYITNYGDTMIANAEEDKVTFLQVKRCLLQEYPDFEFVQTFQRGCTDTIFVRGERSER